MTETVPNSLLALVSMVEHGPDIESQIENGITDANIAIAQLLQYNVHSKQAKGTGSHQRHSSNHEPPFAIYVGLLFAKTRKHNLIDFLFKHGICIGISYNRVLEISTTLGDAVIQKYLEDGVVCPFVLQKGVFTTSAVYDIDHNPSSTTAMTPFHGTEISVFQHPNEMSTIEKYIPPLLSKNIRPGFLKSKPTPPIVRTPALLANQYHLVKNLICGSSLLV
jgi:hypothetical protein